MVVVLKFVAGKLLALLAVVLCAAALGGCYPHDCKPGDACWQNCADDPNGPGCVPPWMPVPIESKTDGGSKS